MNVLANLVRVTVTAAPGIGPIALGPAVAGFLTFAQGGVADGAIVTYATDDSGGREIGQGTYTLAGPTLTRDLVYRSTGAGNTAPISLSASAQIVICPAAEDLAAIPLGSITGLAAGIPAFLATPNSANLAAAVTDETGSGPLVFGTGPTITGGTLSGMTTLPGSGIISATGQLGIKQTTPKADLHIGGTASTARIYNSFTDASNGEWAYLGDWSASVARYGTDKNGTGLARAVSLLAGGVEAINIETDADVRINTSLGIGTSPAAQLHLGGAYTAPGGGVSIINLATAPFSCANTSSIYAISCFPTILPTGASLTNLFGGGIFDSRLSGSTAIDIANWYVIASRINILAGYAKVISNGSAFVALDPILNGAAPISVANGFLVNTVTNGNGLTTGTVFNRGLQVAAITAASAGGTIQNRAAQLTVPSGGSSAGTTNNYGLYLTGNGGTASGGTVNNYSIYNDSSAANYIAGQVLIGSQTTPMTIGGTSNHGLQFASTTGGARITIARASPDTNCPALFLGKSRGTLATAGAVVLNDPLYDLRAIGDDGSTNGAISVVAATLRVDVDGAVSTGIIPTRYVFSVMTTTLVERMRLTGTGLGVRNNNPVAVLSVGGNGVQGTARSYNTMTDSANGEWGYMGDWAANVLRLGSDQNGTGVVRDVQLMRGGVEQIRLGGTGASFTAAIIQKPAASVVPVNNGELTVEATSNTQLTFRFKGSDGTVRANTLPLA